jgi:exosortase
MTFPTSSKLFLVLCTVSAVIWWNVLSGTFRLAVRSDAYTQILLIVPISAMLLFLRLRNSSAEPAPSLHAGAILLVLAAVIGIAGLRWASGTTGSAVSIRWSIEMLALVTSWIGCFVVCFGFDLARRCAFPLLFLLWLVPMPEASVGHLIAFLQQGTATVTRDMFAVVGVPVTQSGTVVTIPGLSVEVAEECSSIRSSLILVVMATVMACLMLRSYWSRAIVMLIALPLAVAKNALRVFTLEALGAYVDPAVLNSPLHHQGGVLFLAIALAALFGIIGLLKRIETRGAKPGSSAKVSRLSMTARP